MTVKSLIMLALLSAFAVAALTGCSTAGSCLQGTGKMFNSMGNCVKNL